MKNKKQRRAKRNIQILKHIDKDNKNEMMWNLINCFLAFMISFLSILIATNEITMKGFGIAFVTGMIVGITRFQTYWSKEEKEYQNNKIFRFL